MSIYTIGDLHLSFHENKPMNIFGENWEGHEEKIKTNWIENVSDNDLVVLPGDFSWSTYLKDTYEDFLYLNSLPGKKLLLKGNHDYWWTTVTNMKKFLEENNFKDIDFIFNTAYEFDKYIIAGTRGWSQTEEGDSKKILKRETLRLELSIQKALEKKKSDGQEIIVFMHYPPITNNNLLNNEVNEFIRIMNKYEIQRCYYGHLHASSIQYAIEGVHFGIDFKLVSADALGFKLIKITE